MKKREDDFSTLFDRASKIPEVSDYLNSFSVIVGDLVRARRIQLGWSQQQLAEAADTTQTRISKIEAGDDGVKMKSVDKVFKALGLNPLNFLPREEAAAKAVV